MKMLEHDTAVGHGLCRVSGAPFDQGWQAAVKESRAIVSNGNFPFEEASGRRATGSENFAPVDAQGVPGLDDLRQRRGAGNPMRELRPIAANLIGKGGVIQLKPAPLVSAALRFDAGLDRDDFQIRVRKICRADPDQAVMRTHERMAAARTRYDAQCLLAPAHALFQRGSQNHQMIESSLHAGIIRQHWYPRDRATSDWRRRVGYQPGSGLF